MKPLDGNAIVYCQGAFNTPNGKTAHGLVRFTRRYEILSVIDERYSGSDAGFILDAKEMGVPIVDSVETSLETARRSGKTPTHFVIGLAPDGGRLNERNRKDITNAITHGLNIDSGLHDFLSDDPAFMDLARKHGITMRDIRKPPDRKYLHFFSGEIESVQSTRVAVLGTDSAVGKITTAWKLVNGLQDRGFQTTMIGTGQTAWLQGAEYGIILDSLVNDFVSGEIEHAIVRAWNEKKPRVMILEGQGSLLNPAYPGGFELIAAGRPHCIILQHAPGRVDYDGFPGYAIHPLRNQIAAVELISEKPVVAVTMNHEGLGPDDIESARKRIHRETKLPVIDPLVHSMDEVLDAISPFLHI